MAIHLCLVPEGLDREIFVVSFVVVIHGGIRLAPTAGAALFNQINALRIGGELGKGFPEGIDILAGLEIETGKHVEHFWHYFVRMIPAGCVASGDLGADAAGMTGRSARILIASK